jgi:sulfonate transport system substrate-binding protein
VLRRTDISSSAIGETQKNVILAAGDVLKRSAVIKADADVPAVASALIDSSFVVRLQ